MGLSFCSKCKNILPPRNSEKFQEIECNVCGLKQKIETISHKEIIKKKPLKGKSIGEMNNPYATYKNFCKKCGFDKAQIIDIPAKYSDEDDIIFLRCGKCGFSEKIGRKIS